MKKLGLLLFAFIIFGVTNLMAEESPKAEKELSLDTSTEFTTMKIATQVPTGLKNAVTEQLFYPSYAQKRNLEGQVYMRLCVCDKSNVKIVGLSATNPYLGSYVKKQLADLYVKNPGCEPGQVFLIKVNFDIIN